MAILRNDKLIREMTGQSMAESSLSPGKTAYDLPMDEVRCRRKAWLDRSHATYSIGRNRSHFATTSGPLMEQSSQVVRSIEWSIGSRDIFFIGIIHM